MQVSIYGYGNLGRYILNEISKSHSKLSVNNIIDNIKWGCDTGVISHSEFIQKKDRCDIVIVAIQDTVSAQEVTNQLVEEGIENIFLTHPKMLCGKLPVLDKEGLLSDYFFLWREKKPVLPYLEYQVADECNLKCKACMHFSNIISNPNHACLEEFEISLKQLANVFDNIERIRLMGGEPLLNHDLADFVKLTRQVFPLSDIRVVTNGLMITEINVGLMDVMRNNSVKFDITQYKPTRKKIGEILRFLDKNHIGYDLGEEIHEFQVRLSDGTNQYSEVYANACLSKMCTFLRNNKLYVCPHIPMLYEQRDFFGFDISEGEFKNNGLDLYSMDGWEILRKLRNPWTLCRFCSTNPKSIKWATGTAHQEDWI